MFRAALRDIPSAERKGAVDRVAERCWLSTPDDVMRRRVGELSRGYKQRVGLAETLLHNPSVLVLDEPTIGLDPNQVRETRQLIRGLGEKHTVLISTHILAEAEAICRRVLIIDDGRIVADDTPEALSDRTVRGAVIAEIKGDADEVRQALAALEAVDHVHVEAEDGWNRCRVAAAGSEDVREAVARVAAENRWPLRELTRTRASLEDVFHRITVGRRWTEGDGEPAGPNEKSEREEPEQP
jgi:ABC-2 type transport system ATP-binding protein